MNHLALLTALIVSFFWMCSPDHSDFIDLEYGEPFYMTVGETVTTPAGDHLMWLAVADNRCPAEVQCPIPGSGRLTFEYLRGDHDTLPLLKHYGLCIADSMDCGNQIPIGTDTLDLLYLYPYPDTVPYPDQDHYEAKFILKQQG